MVMYSTALPAQRTRISIIFTTALRVLFSAFLFAAAGMGAGLFLGILGTVLYGLMKGANVDMANAYKHVAIPVAALAGSVALVGSLVLEARARRQRTSR
jgi:hypothetical protein